MFRQQCKIVVLKYCCSFKWNSSKHFCIYCLLTFPYFCIAPFGTCSSPCIKLHILWSCFYICLWLLIIHVSFASLQYSALQYSFGTLIRFLVPFHVHFFCLAFFDSNHFEFLFQSFWNLYNRILVKCYR